MMARPDYSEDHKITPNDVSWEEGWPKVQAGIHKTIRMIEDPALKFSSLEVMGMYDVVFAMVMNSRHQCGRPKQLYAAYKKAFEDYLTNTVLGRIQHQNSPTQLLSELAKAWNNNKRMLRLLSLFFDMLDRYYVLRHNLDSLTEVARMSFDEYVLQKPFKGQLQLQDSTQQHEQGSSMEMQQQSTIKEKAKEALQELQNSSQDNKVEDKASHPDHEGEALVKCIEEMLQDTDFTVNTDGLPPGNHRNGGVSGTSGPESTLLERQPYRQYQRRRF